MKLVEILARAMEEWPKGVVEYVQDGDGCTWPLGFSGAHNSGGNWILKSGQTTGVEEPMLELAKAYDHSTAIVTREMWQAERERQHINEAADQERKKAAPRANKDGWIRHRGGKCPVDKESYIRARFRSGEQFHWPAYGLVWKHRGIPGDVMAWKHYFATAEQSSEVDDVIDLCVACSEDDMPAAKYFEEGPLQWRDRIHSIDEEQRQAGQAHNAATEARANERAELVSKLAGEGLALLESTSAPHWKDWQEGDIIKFIRTDRETCSFSLNTEYVVSCITEGTNPINVKEDDEGDANGWRAEYFEWVRRP